MVTCFLFYVAKGPLFLQKSWLVQFITPHAIRSPEFPEGSVT